MTVAVPVSCRVRSTVSTLAVALLAAAALAGSTSRSSVAADGCSARSGDVRFRAADGTRLVGHPFGRGRTAVVLAHQTRGSLCQWVEYAQRLARLGVLAFPFDFRGSGESQPRDYPANLRYGGDVAAAVKAVRRLGARKVYVVGASLGGSAVLAAGANVSPPVDGVVSVSGAADLANAIAFVKHLRTPVLYLAGARDVDFAVDARRLYSATPRGRRTLEILPRGEHGVDLVAASPRARTLIERFIRAH